MVGAFPRSEYKINHAVYSKLPDLRVVGNIPPCGDVIGAAHCDRTFFHP